ncbi:dTDP-4-dehydrorhamnose 3,5-epimerase [Mycolicibacterium sp. 120270]|uniref:dTDP-4-dehydrorhamnose 3,5-epimerase n=1 Tax=Mycolicibacterium sp. 120270 TaxID=3090600 RepID=UPI00299CE10D|nr:dTDP-4-dehydrorhamnose 3,5-epimerase [Mycolicibacterium sp. 120270]MDX1887038.1 dTDP-4-dehydrorhamnose 3,5-epimerase [Mycolicibacterium sp. 120270]
MKFTPTSVEGVMIVDLEPHRDERGFFSRSFCSAEFEKHGLIGAVSQTNIVSSAVKGTLRGLHLQVPPDAEAKLVRCTRGEIADVAVDVRPDSPTKGRHVMVTLSADNHRALFLPPYVAHGFQTLVDDTEVCYQVSGPYAPQSEWGFRWNDPEFDIAWPLPVSALSDKDAAWPLVAQQSTAAGA